MNRNRQEKGITLIALVVTIILMLILAGIVLNMTIGEKGIFSLAQRAINEYKQAEANEQKGLDDLYASIKIAGDSKVTLTMEELDEYINSKLQQAKGIKTDVYIYNLSTDVGVYEKTSMTGLTIETDENNKISEYLSYSPQDGYTVLKNGWYFVQLGTTVVSSITKENISSFVVNGVPIGYAQCWVTRWWEKFRE